MSLVSLNLASRPFRNERLPALLLTLAFVALGALTVKHALAIRSLLPGRTGTLERQVAELEAQRAQLRAEAQSLRATRPEAGDLAQWTVLKELVDRRVFAWSALFSVLEEALPPGVRLVSISPAVEQGQVRLDMAAVVRTNDDNLELIRVLEEREEFSDVLPRSRTGDEEIQFRYTMRYHPGVRTAALTPAGPPTPSSPSAAAPAPRAAASPGPIPGATPPALPTPPAAARSLEPAPAPRGSPEGVDDDTGPPERGAALRAPGSSPGRARSLRGPDRARVMGRRRKEEQ